MIPFPGNRYVQRAVFRGKRQPEFYHGNNGQRRNGQRDDNGQRDRQFDTAHRQRDGNRRKHEGDILAKQCGRSDPEGNAFGSVGDDQRRDQSCGRRRLRAQRKRTSSGTTGLTPNLASGANASFTPAVSAGQQSRPRSAVFGWPESGPSHDEQRGSGGGGRQGGGQSAGSGSAFARGTVRTMGSMTEFAQFFALSFTALLPVINPLGSALVFLGMVGSAPASVYKALARQIAFTTALFLVVIDIAGAMVLKLFGISLPVVQLAGGLVLAAMGWGLLNQKEASGVPDPSLQTNDLPTLQRQIFYPFTFPLTAGPGVLVVTLTLSAHASKGELLHIVFAHLGMLCGMAFICLTVFIAYAWAPKITARISPSTAHGVLRVIAFILLCIGVQIAWNGLSSLVATLPFARR